MIKINSLEVENVKRVKAVKLEPTHSGLTVIGGKNGQGKTSILDGIAWLLGGNKFKPSIAKREDSVIDPILHAELSNGLIVERKGANSSLKVIDPQGNKSGQQLLDEFIEELALNLPKFMKASNKEKANILLQIIGVGDKLHVLELKESQIYNRRTEIGRIADQKKKFAAEMTSYPEAPKELVSASELIKKQQDILAINGENQRKRQNIFSIQDKVNHLSNQMAELERQLQIAMDDLEIAKKSAENLHDESTEELEQSITDIDAINIKVRANYDKEKAEIDAEEYNKQYLELTEQIEKVRQSRINLLKTAKLPLEELSVENGELIYKGFCWDNMSGSEQLKVATAIVRKLNPNCGFVLIDKLEQMDLDTLKEFGSWLEKENLQVIATRVSSSDECSIIIEDGYVKNEETLPVLNKTNWEVGKF